MKIIGLTGGIASGKNFVASIFADNGAAIFDADKEVHEIFNCDEDSILKVVQHFPQAFIDGKINRKILGDLVFKNPQKLQILEEIIHPKIREKYLQFLEKAIKNKIEIVVLNIPLLLETKAYKCDKVIALIAPIEARKERFLLRQKKINPEESLQNLEEKFLQIVANQMTNLERERQADFIIETGFSRENTIAQVENILKFFR